MELIIRGKYIIYGTDIWAGLVPLLWYREDVNFKESLIGCVHMQSCTYYF